MKTVTLIASLVPGRQLRLRGQMSWTKGRMGAFLVFTGVLALPAYAGEGLLPNRLVPPFTIVDSDYYLDGGTTSFKIVDARGETVLGGFDGRMCIIESGGPGEPSLNSCTPSHVYIGAGHPTSPGARLLPLWGEEERAVMKVLDAALGAELTDSERLLLLKTDSALKLPDEHAGRLWHLVRRVDRREREIDAIDRGLLAPTDCITGYLGVSIPIVVRSVAFVDSTTTYEVTLADSIRTEFVISLPADSLAASPPPSGMWFREERVYTFPSAEGPTVWRSRSIMLHAFGAMGDRCALTVLMVAVGSMNTEVPGATWRDELVATVRWRIRRTLETDSTR